MAADTPSGYTSGTVSVPAGTPLQLGPLIQQQIDANAAQGAQANTLHADNAKTAPL
jgi:hypothetical protein